ncbi:MAG: hypothetical protein ACFFC3_14295, partial [Candidatus Odinarchaeota archaeon]
MTKEKKKKKTKKKEKVKQRGDTFSQLYAKKGKVEVSSAVTLGESINRSGDKLFLGTDYKEVLIPERPWSEMLANTENWTALP